VDLSPVTGTLRGGILELSPFTLGSGDVRLRSSASVDLQQRSLAASSRGRIDLRALSPLLSGAALAGEADIDVSASGPFDAVAGNGRISVEGVSVRMRDIPQALTDGRGAIVLEGRRLVVPEITARLGGGTIALTGSAGIAGPEESRGSSSRSPGATSRSSTRRLQEPGPRRPDPHRKHRGDGAGRGGPDRARPLRHGHQRRGRAEGPAAREGGEGPL
jgi:hypothetical protein